MAERAPLQDVVRRLQELRGAGRTAQEAATEIQAMGWQPAEVKQRISTMRPADTSDAIAQGLSFGTADEISAALTAPIKAFREDTTMGEAFNRALENKRAALELAKAKHPIAMGASEMAGGALVPIPGGASRSMAGAIGKAAATGAVGGAAYGAGTGENMDDRISRAVGGGVIGGALGGAMGLGQGLWRGAIAQSPSGARGASRSQIADALSDEGVTGTQAADRIAEFNRAGKSGVTAMDVAQGGRVMGLADDVANSPNRAQAALKAQLAQRQMGTRAADGTAAIPGQFDRLAQDLGQLSGVGAKRAVPSVQSLIERRKLEAGPAFTQAWKFDTSTSPPIRAAFEQAAQTPVLRSAWPRAVRIAQSRQPGVPVPNFDDVVNPNGSVRFIPNMQFMHYLKEGMDDTVNRAFKAGDGAVGSAYKEVRNGFRDVLKQNNPEYGKALDKFAGSMALEDAIGAGRAAMMKSPDELAAAMQGLSPSEVEAFRVGALTQVIDVLGNKRPGPTADVAGALTSPNFVRKITALMPDQAAREAWMSRLNAETAMSATARVAGGSQTAGRLANAEQQDMSEQAGRMLADAGHGLPNSLWQLVTTALGKVSKPVANFAKRQRRGATGEMLSLTDQQAEAFLRGLDQHPPSIGYSAPQLAIPAAIGATQQLVPAQQSQNPLLTGR